MLTAIIIDDEENSRETLRLKIQKHCPEVNVLQTCSSGEEGIEAIKKLSPELVFLDIEMPRMSGFDMLEDIEEINFDVIFVTAYNQFAIRAIKFSALDYLLKPINKEDLVKAVERARQKRNTSTSAEQIKTLNENFKSPKKELEKVALPTMEGLIFVELKNIVRLESEVNYTRFYLTNKETILVSKTLGDFEELFAENNFFRPHKSHIINLKFVKKYVKGEGGQIILEDNTAIDVSRRKKEEFLQKIKSF
jgi:two-component system, LytTR family, response regulator